MLSLTYLSTATRQFSEEEMDRLLVTCRINNARLQITGLLLYRPHAFFQTLEGPDETVLGMLETLRSDPRHKNLTLLLQEPVEKRDFADWSMGYYRISEGPEGFSDFLSNTDMAEKFHHSSRRTHQLLAQFRELFNRG